LGVTEVPIEDGYRFGIVETDRNNRIIDYVEKPEKTRNNLASMGIYIFNKETLVKRIMKCGISGSFKHDLTYTVVPEVLKHDRFYAYRFNGYWRDIGTVQAFYEANMEVIDLQEQFIVDSNRPVLTGVKCGNQSVDLKDCSINNSIIGPDCVVKGHVENSILSPGVFIDESAIVKDSVLMPEVSVGYHSVIDKCILDEKVNIGKFSYVGFGNDSSPEEAITVVGKGAVVPSGTAIGSDCKLLPYVGPEDIPVSVVASGSVIRGDSTTDENQVPEPVEVK
jgi:glucose-1-phosphate adenylyltransferase